MWLLPKKGTYEIVLKMLYKCQNAPLPPQTPDILDWTNIVNGSWKQGESECRSKTALICLIIGQC